MTTLTIQIPWLLIVPIALFLSYGIFEMIGRIRQGIRIYRQIQRTQEEQEQLEFLSEADILAQAQIEQKIRETWRSFDLANWLNVNAVWEDIRGHIRGIAKVYHPESERPEFEITVIELLKLNHRINQRIMAVLEPLESLNRLSVNSLLEAQAILERTRYTIDQKGIKTGATVLSRVWQALNIANPQYWINRFLLRGVSEVVFRKAMTSIYRITGSEAMKIYRSSVAEPIEVTATKLENKLEEPGRKDPPNIQEESNILQTLKPEIILNDEVESTDPCISNPSEEPVFVSESTDSGGVTSPTYTVKIYAAIANTFTQFFEGGLQLWEKLASPDAIFRYYQKQGIAVESLKDIQSLPVDTVKSASGRYCKQAEWLSAAEGAATGMGGFMLLAVDAVLLIALQLRTIQQIGYVHGFEMSKPEEKLFAVKLLMEAYQHPSNQDRKALLKQMKWAGQLLNGSSPLKILHKKLFANGINKAAQIIGVRLGTRKAAQMVPFLGAAVGGYFNRKVMKDIASIADEVYRERLISRKRVKQVPEGQEEYSEKEF